MMANPQLMTVAQVATLLHVRKKTVYGWIKAGRLRAARLPGGTDLRLRRSDVDAFVADLFDASGSPPMVMKPPAGTMDRAPDLFALGRSRAG
jgi:excisionase family DNA binding protein